jgi:hypothetical protein
VSGSANCRNGSRASGHASPSSPTWIRSKNAKHSARLVESLADEKDAPQWRRSLSAASRPLHARRQAEALDRTQPSLPLKAGRAKTMTHDYKHNGTIGLFAALKVGTGEVLHQTRERHTSTDVLVFLK